MKSFKNKRVLIVGGSEGIGLALAEKMLLEGADVRLASRNIEKLEKAKELLQKKGEVTISSLDVTQFADLEKSIEKMKSEWGVPDVLINSSGIAHPRYIETISQEEIDQMVDVNFRGVAYLSRLLVPSMTKLLEAQILNVSSVAGYVGLFGYTTYCGSKAAVIAFTEALREELIHTPVSVSVLCPPNTKTPGLEKENEFKPKEVLATEEKAQVLEPEEVAEYTLRALKKEKFMIIPTFESRLALYLKRFSPAVLRSFVRRPKS